MFFWIFALIGTLFLLLGKRACALISGYNFKKRKEYDERRMSRDQMVFWYLLCAIFTISALCSLFFGAVSFTLCAAGAALYFFSHKIRS